MRHMFFSLLIVLLHLSPSTSLAGRVEAIQRGLDATLMVFSADSEERFLGSAFIYGSDGTALTNAHVVGGATYVIVQFRDGRREHVNVLAQDVGRDIAVLHIGGTRAGLTIAQDKLQIGTSVTALGAPLGLGYTATRGIVAAEPRQVDLTVPLRLIQHDAAINPGNSGGPLIDETGALIGMNSQIADGSRYFIGISYAISATDLDRLVPKIRAGTLLGLPVLGFDARAMTRKIGDALRIAPFGLLVDDVIKNGAADLAGLQVGDIIKMVNDTQIENPGEMAFALETAVDSVAEFHVFRQAKMLTLKVALSALPIKRLQAMSIMPARIIRLGDLGVTLDEDGLVSAIDPTSRAMRDGLRAGDRIVAVNGLQGNRERLMGIPMNETALILLARADGRHQHIVLYPWSDRQVLRPLGGNVLDMTVERY